jgi:hypothetical protein
MYHNNLILLQKKEIKVKEVLLLCKEKILSLIEKVEQCSENELIINSINKVDETIDLTCEQFEINCNVEQNTFENQMNGVMQCVKNFFICMNEKIIILNQFKFDSYVQTYLNICIEILAESIVILYEEFNTEYSFTESYEIKQEEDNNIIFNQIQKYIVDAHEKYINNLSKNDQCEFEYEHEYESELELEAHKNFEISKDFNVNLIDNKYECESDCEYAYDFENEKLKHLW